MQSLFADRDGMVKRRFGGIMHCAGHTIGLLLPESRLRTMDIGTGHIDIRIVYYVLYKQPYLLGNVNLSIAVVFGPTINMYYIYIFGTCAVSFGFVRYKYTGARGDNEIYCEICHIRD